ncbi:MAG: DNA-processing protein DprA [Deltaproteobacteria bacterium]|nr:DNA-processing protein DprA [Deltaproteobacteria bacterium]
MDTTRPDKRFAWLALHLIDGLGNVAFKNLLKHFGSPENIFHADLPDLMTVEGLRPETARNVFRRTYTTDPLKILDRVEKFGARIITLHDGEYPGLLREIPGPPALLYAKGMEIPPDRAFVAVVGSRNPTPYGLGAAEKIAQGLARRGVGVVSGMARGIDAAAHWGALGGKGFTVAVLGTGIDRVYPASNNRLFQRITETGIVISEFPPGTPPEPKNFPIRNRVISGLSVGVLVVEATKNSGSLITASLALEQGREVFAVPGSIDSFKSTGCHFLLKQGARLVENADDILDELGFNYPAAPKADTFREVPLPPMESTEKRIYEIIGSYPVHMDQIIKRSGLQAEEVAGTLLEMELKGIIRLLPGNIYVRTVR